MNKPTKMTTGRGNTITITITESGSGFAIYARARYHRKVVATVGPLPAGHRHAAFKAAVAAAEAAGY